MPHTQQLSKSSACLLGGAVGDALGAPIEFQSLQQIKATYGPAGLQTYAPSYGRKAGVITDDTQMTLFTAEGLLRGMVRGMSKGISGMASVVSHAYLRWLKTQNIHPLHGNVSDDGWLFQQPELHHVRAPGNTCIQALKGLRTFTNERADNDSKGCGGVMRAAPVGIFEFIRRNKFEPKQVFNLGCEVAWITHGHPSGYLSAGCFATIIAYLMADYTLEEAIACSLATLKQYPDHHDQSKLIEKACQAATSQAEPLTVIAELGQGWCADEALAIGIYCALKAPDFASGIRLAVNHDGDSDSTGSITGNLLGALWGIEAIEACWLEPLEARMTIEQIAADLVSFPEWDYDSPLTWERYPGF